MSVKPQQRVDAEFGRWKHFCRISCDVENTEFMGRLFTLMTSVRFPHNIVVQ